MRNFRGTIVLRWIVTSKILRNSLQHYCFLLLEPARGTWQTSTRWRLFLSFKEDSFVIQGILKRAPSFDTKPGGEYSHFVLIIQYDLTHLAVCSHSTVDSSIGENCLLGSIVPLFLSPRVFFSQGTLDVSRKMHTIYPCCVYGHRFAMGWFRAVCLLITGMIWCQIWLFKGQLG